eukprot:15369-Eustigmatos_ZCMA.PRE.1
MGGSPPASLAPALTPWTPPHISPALPSAPPSGMAAVVSGASLVPPVASSPSAVPAGLGMLSPAAAAAMPPL